MGVDADRRGAGVADAPRAGGHDPRAASRLLAAADGLESLDRLAGLAAGLLGTPAAQLSVLTGAQWIAGGFGLPGEVRTSMTPLTESLCTVTASCGEPLVVPDTRADERVSGLPPVVSGAVGSYLGVPLRAATGGAVGALCVFGPEVREWSASDLAVLEQLGEWAGAELELAALGAELDASRRRWELSVEAAGIGSFEWDLVTDRVSADARMRELFGVPEDEPSIDATAFIAAIHPDDAPRVRQLVSDTVRTLGEYRTEHRILFPSGAVRWVRVLGRVEDDAKGRPLRLLGSALDTTADNDADARANHVLESMSAGFVALDRDWRLTYMNTAAEQLLGLVRADVLGHDLWELFPQFVGTVFEEIYRRAAATGLAQSAEAYYPEPFHAWYEVRAQPSAEGLSIFFVDVTSRHEAQELVELSSEVSQRLSGALDVTAAMQDLVRSLVPRLADWALVSAIEPGGQLRDLATWHADPALRATVARYAATRLDGRDDESVAAAVMRTAEPLVLPSGALGLAESVLRSPEAIELIRVLAPESVVALPLRAGDRQRGALTLLRCAERSPMTKQEIGVAATIAQRAGMALDNARLFATQRETAARLSQANRRLRDVAEHQRTVAQALQEAMLTQLPEPEGLQLAARYLTASIDEQVGGDWYDALELPGGATVVSIGDVVGHDIHAAGTMGQLRNMLRMVAWDRDEDPSAVVGRLDWAMGSLHVDTLATLLMLRIAPGSPPGRPGHRTLCWTAAGHPAPVLVHADGTAALLEQRADLLLGVDPARPRHDGVHVAPPGATLLLYTDGLVETRAQGVAAGQESVLHAVRRLHGLPVDQLVDRVIADVVGEHPADDVAVLAVRF